MTCDNFIIDEIAPQMKLELEVSDRKSSLLSPRYFGNVKVLRQAVQMLIELFDPLLMCHGRFLCDALLLLE